MPSKAQRSQIFSTFLGNFMEHYDKALFVVLAPFIASEFFPDFDRVSALIATYAILPIGMLARPIGSLFFGYIGDVKGRIPALRISLFGMGLVSAFVMLLPSYDRIGFFAPILFSLARMFANFFSSGETMGGSVYVLENSAEKRQDLLSGFYSASTVFGYLVASSLVSLFAYWEMVQTHWRFLYLLGAGTSLLGVFMRKEEVVRASTSTQGWVRNQFRILMEHRASIFRIAVISGFYYSCYSIALTMLSGFLPLIADVRKEDMAYSNTALLVIDFLLLPLCGFWARKFTREKVMGAASLAVLVFGVPLFSFLQGADFATICLVRFAIVLVGVFFSASFHAWALQNAPAEHRYTVLSFGYALGTQLLGGTTSVICLLIFQTTGSAAWSAIYWVFLALCSSLVLFEGAFATRKVSYAD